MLDIRDETLRQRAIRAVTDAMERGGWNDDNVGRAPATVTYEGVRFNLIEHVKQK